MSQKSSFWWMGLEAGEEWARGKADYDKLKALSEIVRMGGLQRLIEEQYYSRPHEEGFFSEETLFSEEWLDEDTPVGNDYFFYVEGFIEGALEVWKQEIV